MGYFINCQFNATEERKTPVSVSLTTSPCDFAENLLEIVKNQPENGIKKKFGVCVKFTCFDKRDFMIKFVEWVHLLRVLGVDKIHMYNRYVHADTYKAMKYFESLDWLEVREFLEPFEVPFKHPTDDGRASKRAVEIMTINDCIYRNRELYEYILVVDPDEIPIPRRPNETTLYDFLKVFEDKNIYDSYSFHCVTYPDLNFKAVSDVPEYHYMLQHIRRSKEFMRYHNFERMYLGKALYSMDNDEIISVNHHGTQLCHNRPCEILNVPEEAWQMSHYRDSIKEPSDSVTIEDLSLIHI